jgi:hypothetical protein
VDSYAAFSWISVMGETPGPPRALIRLLTNLRPFDTVQVASLDPDTFVPIERAVLPFGEAKFAFVRRSSSQQDVEVREIEAID